MHQFDPAAYHEANRIKAKKRRDRKKQQTGIVDLKAAAEEKRLRELARNRKRRQRSREKLNNVRAVDIKKHSQQRHTSVLSILLLGVRPADGRLASSLGSTSCRRIILFFFLRLLLFFFTDNYDGTPPKERSRG